MGEAAAKEPSMEDILSSIRKIISDEDKPASQQSSHQEAPKQPATPEPSPAVSTDQTAEVKTEQPIVSQSLSEITNRLASSKPRVDTESAAVTTPTESPAPVSSTSAPMTPSASTDSPSGADAAKMAGSLASIVDTVKSKIVDDASPGPNHVGEEMPGTNSLLGDRSASSYAENLPGQDQTTTPPVEQATVSSNEELAASASEVKTETSPADAESTWIEIDAERPVAPATPQPSAERFEVPALASAVESLAATTGELQAPATEKTDEAAAFKGALMSPSTSDAVSNSFDRLKRSTMDDMDAKAESILRPMLREWLDQNLPSMVERLVREEIERVARNS